MKAVMIAFFLLIFSGTAFAASCSKVELRDIQGLFGGQSLVLKSSGEFVTRIVKPVHNRLYEKRYVGRVNFAEVVRGLDLAQLDHYRETVRAGMPDESRPKIRVWFTNGAVKGYSKWAEDSDEHFDRVYRKLLKLAHAKNGRLVYSGNYAGTTR